MSARQRAVTSGFDTLFRGGGIMRHPSWGRCIAFSLFIALFPFALTLWLGWGPTLLVGGAVMLIAIAAARIQRVPR